MCAHIDADIFAQNKRSFLAVTVLTKHTKSLFLFFIRDGVRWGGGGGRLSQIRSAGHTHFCFARFQGLNTARRLSLFRFCHLALHGFFQCFMQWFIQHFINILVQDLFNSSFNSSINSPFHSSLNSPLRCLFHSSCSSSFHSPFKCLYYY